MKNNYIKFLAFFLSFGFAVNSYGLDPAGIGLGSGFSLFPKIRLEYNHDTNVYSRRSNIESSNIYRVIPSFALVKDTGQTYIQFFYELDKGIYSVSDRNNYLDNFFSFDFDTEFNARNRFDFKGSYDMTHDDRGKGLIPGSADPSRYDLETYNELNLEAGYGLGSEVSFVNTRAYVKYYDKKYNDLNLPVIESQNHYKRSVGMTVRFTPGKRLGIVGDAEYTQIRYHENSNFALKREGTNTRFQIGLEWEFTSVTSGEAKAGVAKRTFTYTGFDDTPFRPVWEVKIIWEPLESTKLTALSGSENTESAVSGSHIQKNRVELALDHEFSAFFKTNLSGEYVTNKIIQGDSNSKAKSTEVSSLKVKGKLIYSPRRWADIELGVEHGKYGLDEPTSGYDVNIYTLALELAI